MSQNDTLRQLATAKGLAYKEIAEHFRSLQGQMEQVQQTVIYAVTRAETVDEIKRVVSRLKDITFLG